MSGKVGPTKDWQLLPKPGHGFIGQPDMYARRHGAGVWYILRFRKPHPQDIDQGSTCDVRRLDLSETSKEELEKALCFCGIAKDHVGRLWVDSAQGLEIAGNYRDVIEVIEVACANRYGLGMLLRSVHGKDPVKVYLAARRTAGLFMSSPAALEAELDHILKHDWKGYLRGFGISFDSIWKGYGTAYTSTSCTIGITHPKHYWPSGGCKCSNKVHRSAMRQFGWVGPHTLQHIPVQPVSPEVTRPWR